MPLPKGAASVENSKATPIIILPPFDICLMDISMPVITIFVIYISRTFNIISSISNTIKLMLYYHRRSQVMDGLTAAAVIRALEVQYQQIVPRSCLPILAVSAHDKVNFLEQCQGAGMQVYL